MEKQKGFNRITSSFKELQVEYKQRTLKYQEKGKEIDKVRDEFDKKIKPFENERDMIIAKLKQEREILSNEKTISLPCSSCNIIINSNGNNTNFWKISDDEYWFYCSNYDCKNSICSCGKVTKNRIQVKIAPYGEDKFCSYECPKLLEAYELGKIFLNSVEVSKLYAPESYAAKKAAESFEITSAKQQPQ